MNCNGFCTICPFGCKSTVVVLTDTKVEEQPKVETDEVANELSVVPTSFKVKKNVFGKLIAKEIK